MEGGTGGEGDGACSMLALLQGQGGRVEALLIVNSAGNLLVAKQKPILCLPSLITLFSPSLHLSLSVCVACHAWQASSLPLPPCCCCVLYFLWTCREGGREGLHSL